MKISVCIPTYNQADYIADTIASVVAQVMQPDEIIISNDCSTDGTLEVLKQLEKQIPILKVIDQPKNLGMSRNTDFVLRATKGEVIVKLDSDDMLLPNYIQKLYPLLQQYSEAGYAHADVQEIDENGTVTKERLLYRKTGFVSADEALKAAVNGYKVAANIIMFRRKALEDAGFILNHNNFAEDFYLSVNIADAGWGNVYCKETLSRYRVWSDAGQVRQKRKLVEVTGLTAVFNEAFTPAFAKRNWDKQILNKAREEFAIVHGASLGWNLFTKAEKEELKEAILKLSGSPKTQRYISAYLQGKKPPMEAYRRMKSEAKKLVKQVLKKFT